MASRAIDFLITYRVIKLLSTPFDKQEAFATGVIDKDGKVLKKNKDLKTEKEKNSYTTLHRFIFNLKRILAKVGISGSIASFGVALALLLKENEEMIKHKSLIEIGLSGPTLYTSPILPFLTTKYIASARSLACIYDFSALPPPCKGTFCFNNPETTDLGTIL